MFVNAYLDTAAALLRQYTGQEPFHLYLKNYYGGLKKFGARDRRHITQLCYAWLRAGHALQQVAQREQFSYALFLCSESENKLLEKLDATLHQDVTKALDKKVQLAAERAGFQVSQLFPWNNELSTAIEPVAFDTSFVIQPDLYLRLRPAREAVVLQALQQAGILFEQPTSHCLAVKNGSTADALLALDQDAVVQDRNSQRVLELLQQYGDLKKFTAWDCCAASGGKSLLLHDLFPGAQLTVSDVRESILHNLRKRFRKAGIKNYHSFVANAATNAPQRGQPFDVILCDVPCSGSGTWSRTPEQLHHFQAEKIDQYAQLQKSIGANVWRYLKPGGFLLYSTCSVFEKENEAVVQHLQAHTPLRFIGSAYYKGYDQRADTLFAALFQLS